MFNRYREKHQLKADTESFTYDPDIKPIKIRISFRRLYDELSAYLKENEYDNIYEYEKYHELFGTKGEYELTFSIIEVELEGLCILNISLYDEFKKGSAYKAIKPLIKEIKEKYKPLIVE